MTQIHYYKADRATSNEIVRLLDERLEMFAKAQKMAKRVGADPKQVYSYISVFGVTHISGFGFKVDPDPKKWIRVKGTDAWKPRARTELADEMNSLNSLAIDQIHKLIGMNPLGKGLFFRRVGVKVGKDAFCYLSVPDDVTPIGCKRISDIQYQKVL